MADQTAAWLSGIDEPRYVPEQTRVRLEQAIIANTLAPEPENFPWILSRAKRLPEDMHTRLTATLAFGDADIAELMYDIDAPRELPLPVQHRIRGALLRKTSMRRVYQVLGAAAVAVVVVAASVLLAVRNDRGTSPINPHIALPTILGSQPSSPQLTPSPATSVLGLKAVNPTPSSAAPLTPGYPQPAGESNVGSVADQQTPNGISLTRIHGSAQSLTTHAEGPTLIEGVTGLLGGLLRDLGLSLGKSGSSHHLPADEGLAVGSVGSAPSAAQTPAPPAPQTYAAPMHHRSHHHFTAPSTPTGVQPTPAAETAPPKPPTPALLSVSVAGISLSL